MLVMRLHILRPDSRKETTDMLSESGFTWQED